MKSLLAASALVLVCAALGAPAFAADRVAARPGVSYGGTRGAPAPVAGAGLLTLAAFGVLYLVRRRPN